MTASVRSAGRITSRARGMAAVKIGLTQRPMPLRFVNFPLSSCLHQRDAERADRTAIPLREPRP